MKKPIIFILILFFANFASAETFVYFSPNGGCTGAILDEIRNARTSIDIMMYSFSSRPIANELIRAKERGVRVRVLLEKAQRKQKYTSSRYLIKKGINVRFDTGKGLMHNKVGIVDGRVLITGSFNWTASAEKRNAENLLIINDEQIIPQYRKKFEELWDDGEEFDE